MFDFKITPKCVKCQSYCKMVKVTEAIKSFLNAVQKPKSYVNMQCVMQCKSNTHILVCLVSKETNQSFFFDTDSTDILALHWRMYTD